MRLSFCEAEREAERSGSAALRSAAKQRRLEPRVGRRPRWGGRGMHQASRRSSGNHAQREPADAFREWFHFSFYVSCTLIGHSE